MPPPSYAPFDSAMQSETVPAPAIITTIAPQHQVGFNPQQRKTLIVLSILQIVIGVSSAIINIAQLALHRRSNFEYVDFADQLCAGIWCGGMYIIAGSLGVTAARQNRRIPIVGTIVWSILSSLSQWVVLAIAAAAISLVVTDERNPCVSYKGLNSYYSKPCVTYNFSGYKAGDGMLIFLSITELVVSIWCCVLCCKGSIRACCSCCFYESSYVYHISPMNYASANAAEQQGFIVTPAGVDGRHTIGLIATQPFYLGAQQPALCTYHGVEAAVEAPPSYETSIVGPPEYSANQMEVVAAGGAAYEQRGKVTKDRTAVEL